MSVTNQSRMKRQRATAPPAFEHDCKTEEVIGGDCPAENTDIGENADVSKNVSAEELGDELLGNEDFLTNLSGENSRTGDNGFKCKTKPSSYYRYKPLLDRLLAAMLLVPGVPIIVFLSLLARLSSRGPGIFRQARVGKKGRIFTMYKIRTMRHDAEKKSGAVWAKHGDRRTTFLGKILRKLHLDELPQLWNVVRGDMLLIGPRPERPEFVHILGRMIPGYLERLAVEPGITGLAQINLEPDTDLQSVRKKLVLDMEYITKASVLLDIRMLLCTLTRVVGIPGLYAMNVFGLSLKITSRKGKYAIATLENNIDTDTDLDDTLCDVCLDGTFDDIDNIPSEFVCNKPR